MDIKHVENRDRGAFLIRKDGKRLAETTYSKAGDSSFIIDHTEVDPSLRGQHIGEELVAAAVEHARKNKLKIFATCPYATAVFQKHPEYSDVFPG